jgi:hypothetical protein
VQSRQQTMSMASFGGGSTRRIEDRFVFGMCLLILATVVLGFARSYFLIGLWNAPLPSRFVQVHAALFSCWIILLIAQVLLVATGQVRLHRKIGMGGAARAAGMIVSGFAVALDSAARGFVPPGSPFDPKTFLAVRFQ